MPVGYVMPKINVKLTLEAKPKKKRKLGGFDLECHPSPPNTKMTDDQYQEVRWLHTYGGKTNKELACMYGVSLSVMSNATGYITRIKLPKVTPNMFYFEGEKLIKR